MSGWKSATVNADQWKVRSLTWQRCTWQTCTFHYAPVFLVAFRQKIEVFSWFSFKSIQHLKYIKSLLKQTKDDIHQDLNYAILVVDQ